MFTNYFKFTCWKNIFIIKSQFPRLQFLKSRQFQFQPNLDHFCWNKLQKVYSRFILRTFKFYSSHVNAKNTLSTGGWFPRVGLVESSSPGDNL